jgi:GH24 family phage-related lysozyme (muramidase)
MEALISYGFNMGLENLAGSDLLKCLNDGEDPNTVAKREFPKWVVVKKRDENGKVINAKTLLGLVERRKNEVKRFCTKPFPWSQ